MKQCRWSTAGATDIYLLRLTGEGVSRSRAAHSHVRVASWERREERGERREEKGERRVEDHRRCFWERASFHDRMTWRSLQSAHNSEQESARRHKYLVSSWGHFLDTCGNMTLIVIIILCSMHFMVCVMIMSAVVPFFNRNTPSHLEPLCVYPTWCHIVVCNPSSTWNSSPS